MNADRRLSSALHLLLHLDAAGEPRTSEALAGCVGTNAVVVRQVLGGLRDAGLVHSGKGRGGGWSLARPLAAITVDDVYLALGEPPLFTLGLRGDGRSCRVEAAVNAAVADSLSLATTTLRSRFAAIHLAELAAAARHAHSVGAHGAHAARPPLPSDP